MSDKNVLRVEDVERVGDYSRTVSVEVPAFQHDAEARALRLLNQARAAALLPPREP